MEAKIHDLTLARTARKLREDAQKRAQRSKAAQLAKRRQEMELRRGAL